MKLINIKRKFIDWYANSRGWRTNRKILVIESDDWGSIRMPSYKVYTELLNKGFPVDRLSYMKYDSLESNSDLSNLFDVLSSFRDKNGNHPVITANTIMTNPDFEKIRQSGFNEYHAEIFTETLKKYPEHDRVYHLYLQGIKEKIFYPQLHGMEHLNVKRWMNALKNGNSATRLAFDYEMFDLSSSHTEISESSFMDSLSPTSHAEIAKQNHRIIEASKLFYDTFGYASKTFIAPCYVWRPEHEAAFSKSGFQNIQSGSYQLVPEIGIINKFNKKLHFTGQYNSYNTSYTVRNCFFEPSNYSEDVVEKCLSQIKNAFRNNKPAIISSHRLNFIGGIVRENRERNLLQLDKLLAKILSDFSDVEFFHSADLSELINN